MEAKCYSIHVGAVVVGGTLNELWRFREDELWGFRNNGVLSLLVQAYISLLSTAFYWAWKMSHTAKALLGTFIPGLPPCAPSHQISFEG